MAICELVLGFLLASSPVSIQGRPNHKIEEPHIEKILGEANIFINGNTGQRKLSKDTKYLLDKYGKYFSFELKQGQILYHTKNENDCITLENGVKVIFIPDSLEAEQNNGVHYQFKVRAKYLKEQIKIEEIDGILSELDLLSHEIIFAKALELAERNNAQAFSVITGLSKSDFGYNGTFGGWNREMDYTYSFDIVLVPKYQKTDKLALR